MTAHSSASAITVHDLDDAAVPRWDRFVEACPQASFFHRAGWKAVIENSLGHRGHYLYAESGGDILGVLPLIHVRSRLFGNALISNAFCVEGGPAAVHDGAREALTARAVALAETLDVDHLEYRGTERHNPGWACRDDRHAVFRKALPADPERALQEVPRKQRAVIRQALRNDLSVQLCDQVDGFFAAYADSVHALGTPVLPKRYFRDLARVFGEACEIMEVRHRGAVVGGLISFTFRGRVLPYYGGGTAAARDLGVYNFMYWDLMRRACLSGLTEFDFGRSKVGTGAYRYKTFWGFEPTPLVYEYFLRRGELPDHSPLNPRYRTLIALWKRLPLAVANTVGPWLARDLG